MFFFAFLIDFSLKSIFLEIRIATLACFLGPLDWKLSPTLYLRQRLSLKLPCVSCIQEKDGFILVSSLLVCVFFIGESNPFILRDINDQWLLVPVILVFIVGDGIVCVFPFFGICCCDIIYCPCFMDITNIPGLEFSF